MATNQDFVTTVLREAEKDEKLSDMKAVHINKLIKIINALTIGKMNKIIRETF